MNMKMPHLMHAKKDPASSSARKNFAHSIGRSPFTDWGIIFCLTIIVTAALIFLGFMTFEDAKSQLDAVSGSSASVPVALDTKSLTQVLGRFDDRAAETSRLLKGYDGPGDPSL